MKAMTRMPAVATPAMVPIESRFGGDCESLGGALGRTFGTNDVII